MKPLLLPLILFAASQAQAQCLIKDTVKLESRAVAMGTCQKVQPKMMEGTTWYFNISNDPMTVKYWAGGYQKSIRVQDKILVQVTNICTGKVSSKNVTTQMRNETKSFDIQNPNMNSNLQHSYELYPLTDSEVRTEMVRLAGVCQTYSLQQAQDEFASIPEMVAE